MRAQLSAFMGTKGVTVDPAGLIVTTGSQQALDLLGKTLISPGDKVIVEGPTFLATIQCFRLYGAQLISAPVDAHGVDTDALEALIAEHQPGWLKEILAGSSPSAALVAEAVAEGTGLTFSHTPAGASDPTTRRVEPWWTGSRHGHWYLVGHDLDRGEPRTFRLVRISDVKATRAARTVPVPPTEQVLALLDDAVSRLNPLLEATVWVADGRAAELRAMARSATPARRFGRSGADLGLSAPLGELSALVAAQGPDAVALEPAELGVRVVSILSAAEEAVR